MAEVGWTEWVRVGGKVHHGITRWPPGTSTDDVVVTPEEMAAADEADGATGYGVAPDRRGAPRIPADHDRRNP